MKVEERRPIRKENTMKGGATFVLGYLVIAGTYHAAEYAMRFHNNIPAFLGLMLAVVGVAIVVAKAQGFRGGSAWGLRFNGHFAKLMAIGLLVELMVTGIALAVRLGLGIEVITEVPAWQTVLTQTLVFSIGTFLPSLAEDILTRGYLFGHLKDKVSGIVFVLLSALVYVLNHIYAYESGAAMLTYLFVLGILLAIPLVMTRNLWYTVGAHWAGNILYRFTNDVITVQDGANNFPGLWVLTLVLLLFIPVHYWITKKLSRSAVRKE